MNVDTAQIVLKMWFFSYLPSQSRYKVFIGLAAGTVGQNGALVLLAFSNVEHGNLVCLPTEEEN